MPGVAKRLEPGLMVLSQARVWGVLSRSVQVYAVGATREPGVQAGGGTASQFTAPVVLTIEPEASGAEAARASRARVVVFMESPFRAGWVSGPEGHAEHRLWTG